MNREIKFRGKRIDNREMVEGDLIHGVGAKKGRVFILPKIMTTPCIDGHEVYIDTIGQYTGLKDKDGREIYEGDVGRSSSYSSPMIIQWHSDGYWMAKLQKGQKVPGRALFLMKREFSDFRLVGNIHDNPELLKVEK